MPHCIVEYAKNLENHLYPTELVNTVYSGALKSQLFNADDIKVRASAYDHFTSGIRKQDFIHVTLKILSGRTPEQRTHLSQTVLSELALLPFASISMTVEVIDIDKSSYSKIVR